MLLGWVVRVGKPEDKKGSRPKFQPRLPDTIFPDQDSWRSPRGSSTGALIRLPVLELWKGAGQPQYILGFCIAISMYLPLESHTVAPF